MKSFLGLDLAVPRAVDVGCGTGLSTHALLDVARLVLGVDPSAAMVAHATRAPGLSYVVGRGEELPLTGTTLDLITAASAIHWLEQEPFLAEARRVLRPDGHLAIYNNYFRARSGQEDPFNAWHRGVYLKEEAPEPRSQELKGLLGGQE